MQLLNNAHITTRNISLYSLVQKCDIYFYYVLRWYDFDDYTKLSLRILPIHQVA